MKELTQGDGWRMAEETVLLPSGREKTSLRVHRNDTVHILPLVTPRRVLLLREYRPFFKEWLWLIPSGKTNPGEELEAAAQRELREEAGYRAGKLEFFCSCIHSETFAYRNQLFVARDLTPDPLPQDEDESIEVHELEIEDALERVLSSDRTHSISAMCLLRYLHKLA